MRKSVFGEIPHLPKAFTAGVIITAAIMLLLFATEHLSSESTRANLRHSFAENSLQLQDWRWTDRRIGTNQYNDCLLVMMARFSVSPWRSAVAPVVVFGGDATPRIGPKGRHLSQCEIARLAVLSDSPGQLFEPESYIEYSRYVHAYRIPFQLLISVTTVHWIRILYRALLVGTMLGIFLAHCIRYRSMRRSANRAGAAAHLGFAWISLCFLALYGLDFYGPSLTHAPADLLVFAAFGWLSLRNPAHGDRDFLYLGALGALAFGFDFLHGTIPLTLAVLLGCTALRSYAAGGRLTARDLSLVAGTFCLGAGGALAAKLIAVAAVQSAPGIVSFFDQLAFRVGGDNYTYLDVARHLGRRIGMIFWGNRPIGVAVVSLSVAAMAIALIRAAMRNSHWQERQLVFGLGLSAGVILLWYLTFKNHSAIHGFMVRLLVWIVAVGPLALTVSLLRLRKRNEPGSSSSLPPACFGQRARP